MCNRLFEYNDLPEPDDYPEYGNIPRWAMREGEKALYDRIDAPWQRFKEEMKKEGLSGYHAFMLSLAYVREYDKVFRQNWGDSYRKVCEEIRMEIARKTLDTISDDLIEEKVGLLMEDIAASFKEEDDEEL